MKTTLITGANRGLGLEFARQLKERDYYVIGACRDPSGAQELKQIADEILQLDVTSDEDILKISKKLDNRPIDLLVNNAGITGEQGITIGKIPRDNFLQVLNVNCVGTVKLTDALLPNVQASEDKSILVISSRMGSITENDRGRSYAYRASKAALNCAMRSFAIDVQAQGIHVMLIHPGWVRTNIGGPDAPVDVHTSVNGMLEQLRLYMADSHAQVLRLYDGGVAMW